jgi:outer membrane protein OmpA-like peptidoglycan-associated protein
MGYVLRKLRHGVCVTCMGLGLCLGQSVHAVNVQQFTRSNSLTYETLEDARLNTSHVYTNYKLLFVSGISYVDSPLVIKTLDNEDQLATVIQSAIGLHLGMGYWWDEDWMLGVTAGYNFFGDQQDNNLMSFSDLKISVKKRMYSDALQAFTVMPFVAIPLGGDEFTPQFTNGTPFPEGDVNFFSDESVGLGGSLLYERLFQKLSFVVNAGYRYAGGAQYDEIDKVHLLFGGVGVFYPLTPKIGLNAEWNAQFTFPLFETNQEPTELYLGSSFGIFSWMHGFAGVGFGNFLQSNDGNDYRLSAGIKWIPQYGRRPGAEVYQAVERVALVPSQDIAREICRPRYLFGQGNGGIIRFEHDKAKHKITPPMSQALDHILEDEPMIDRVDVVGHASAVGKEAYNERLSKKRAQYFANLLMERGFKAEKIFINARGESELLREEMGPEDERLNRRIEFLVSYAPEHQTICTDAHALANKGAI